MSLSKLVTLLPAAAITATATGAAMTTAISSKPIVQRSGDVANSQLQVSLEITAVSGTTPTLDLVIQGQFVPGGQWNPLPPLTGQASAAWTQATATTTTWLQVRRYDGPLPLSIRAVATVAGTTPSFTVAVYGQLGG